ncbi:hypothetical protein LTR36_006092 [Oleoguttula mirabilis]|uniref:DUF7165 domain-containing protein n=1 Tax=Oleoguttula mirabilis TaxID=1507867 RepID=A0AAV9JDN8_9PEZI|nr:hypothetical protein LTR36_006092 [Oleoguttula mirabilis]
MPVSRFSSGNSAVRGHGRLIERWNSTRERIAEDERRMSVSEITEMDGTGLYERPDWPLAATATAHGRSVSPEGADDVGDGRRPQRTVERVRSEAVMRRSEDIGGLGPMDGAAGFPEREVSDVDDEEGRDTVSEEDGGEGSTARQEQPGLAVPREEAQAEVSPVRHEGRDSVQTIRNGRTPTLPERDGDEIANYSLQSPRIPQPEVSPVREERPSPPSPNGGPRTRPEHVNGYNWDRASSSSRTGYPSPDFDRQGEDTQVEAESRDLATPIPFGADDATLRSHSPSTPRINGTVLPTVNGQGRVNSMMKSAPLSRSASRASSHQTTHIPHNKDRVRYSWQSLQDDEPSRPRIHIIKLVSEVATASAGFPGGEAFGFSISSGGRRIAAYNSARLYVLQTAALPVGISQDYALKRRPLAVEIVDEGNVMAILADEHTVNIYDLGHQRLRRTRTIKLDFPTNCIALAPTGGLIAAAYEGGVEIFSLDPSALATDRRAVRSQRMDRLTFSEDGSTLLGTTTRINVSSTVIVSVPVFPAAPSGVPTHEELKEAWCSELLHPENIRNSSHATFMRETRQSCNDRLYSWNGLADTFGILNISDMQYGNIDFPVVISPPLSTCGGLGAAIHSCPAIDEHGDTVAMIVNDRTIRLYIVPHKVEEDETTVEAHSIDHELDEGYGCPFSEVRWVYSSASLPAPLNNQTQVQGRLIVTSPGGVVEQGMSEEIVDDVEGGRIILFDFDPQFAGQPGQTFSLTLGKSPPQLLEEQEVDVADEVALVRRRTVNQSKSGGLSQRPLTLGRAATTFNSGAGQQQRTLRSASPSLALNLNSSRRSMMSVSSMQSEATRSLPDLLETNEAGEAVDVVDEPYAQNAPRSQATMQRAASNAQRHRFQALEERSQERVSVDSSGGFLPLPEYTEEPNAPLPSRFRAMAGLDAPPQPPPKPAIVTSMNGNSGGPATAPANMHAENFSAEQAFRTAAATYSHVAQQRRDDVAAAMQAPPAGGAVKRSETFNSIASMPRSLQRAYSNAISPLGSGPPPSLIGDWENVSPVVPGGNLHQQMNGNAFAATPSSRSPGTGTMGNGNGSLHSPSTTIASSVVEEESWGSRSPVASPTGQQQPSSPFTRAQQAASGNPYRYSASLLSSPGHALPHRASSNASSPSPPLSAGNPPASSDTSRTASSPAGGGHGHGRRMPPHMQAFRNAAAASASHSASLFPPTQAADHVPLRAPLPSKAGSVAHPITAWHPPAASQQQAPPRSAPGPLPLPPLAGHSRKSSLGGKSAFASTEKAKKLGFFKRRKQQQQQAFMPGGYPADGGEGSVMETRSVFTVMTGRENKCSVM